MLTESGHYVGANAIDFALLLNSWRLAGFMVSLRSTCSHGLDIPLHMVVSIMGPLPHYLRLCPANQTTMPVATVLIVFTCDIFYSESVSLLPSICKTRGICHKL